MTNRKAILKLSQSLVGMTLDGRAIEQLNELSAVTFFERYAQSTLADPQRTTN